MSSLTARRQPEAAGWYKPAHLLGADLVIGLLALIGGSALFLRPMWSLGDGTPKIEASWAVLGIVAAGLLWQRFRADWVIYLGRRMPDLVFVHFMAVASVIWSLEPALSAERALWLLSTTMVGICIGYSRDPKQVMAIIMWLFTFFVAASVIAVFLFPDFGQHPRSEHGGVLIDPSLTGRWRGILLNKNEFGSIASGAAVFFAIASLHGRISPVVGLPLFVLAVLMVLMSASATAHVLLILSSVTILLFYVSKKFKVTNIVFALSLILGSLRDRAGARLNKASDARAAQCALRADLARVPSGCATDAASSPSHRPGRDRVRRSANLLRSDHHAVASVVQRKVVPSCQSRCSNVASLRASATFAFLEPLRLASLMAQALRDDQRSTLVSRTFAASNR